MKKNSILFAALVIISGFSSCIKNMDSPPAGGTDPTLTVNFTIDSVVATYIAHGSLPYQFTQNLIISGIVAGDDSSGNLYHEVALEDSTAGIMVLLDNSYLYQSYPVGRRLFIQLNGLWVTQKDGVYEIAYASPGGTLGAMPSSFFANYIFPGKWGLPVVPKAVSITQLNNSYLSELIELNNVEFAGTSAGAPFANGYTQTSATLIVTDCSGNTSEVYTSGFADFANLLSPKGNGKLLAIYGTYNGAPQLTLRDISDVAQMNGPDCNGAVNGSFPIASVSAQYTNAPVTLAAGTIITGTVISDVANGNFSPNNLVIQDASGGICINFTSTNTFPLGAEVTINLSGGTLSPYNGWLQVSQVPNGNATQIGTGTITPKSVTISQINANPSAYESTLVQLSNIVFSGSSTFSGNITMTEGPASADLYTLTSASFAGITVPPSSKAVTCIVEQYNAVQLQIRNLSDVQ